MTELTDFTDGFLENPLMIQKKILNEYHDRTNGGGIVVDPNNTFMFSIESTSRLVSDLANLIDNKLRQVYPRRAMVTEDLYNHISYYDYVGFYSSPADLPMRLMLHKDFIINNAIDVAGTNYKKVVIPKDTIFDVGGYKFSMYYPIEIRVNPIVNSISVVYDTEVPNPLHSLNNNSILIEEVVNNGITLISFEFSTYQFDKQVTLESVNTTIGFNKRFAHKEKFYAVRVWDNISGEELMVTMSDEAYDTVRGTVILKVFPEDKEIQLDIPQVYFTNGIIGNQLRVELYSTMGEIDLNLNMLKLEDIKANFALDLSSTDTTYAKVLRNIPTLILVPGKQRVHGGSNGYSFEDIKDSVVYNSGSEATPITNLDIDNYFKKNGFRSYKKLDNLTDRRYYAYKKLSLSDDLAVANGSLSLRPEDLSNNVNVSNPTANTLVVLPSMIYKYNVEGSRFIPITTTEYQMITTMSDTEKVEELNLNTYLINPYHMVLRTEERYPTAKMYDLFNIATENIAFLDENVNLSAQMSVVSAQISHADNGSGGYNVRVGVSKTSEFDSIDISDRQLYMSIVTTTSSKIGIVGTYVGEYEDLSIYDFTISTDYNLVDDTITVTNLVNTSGSALGNPIALKGKLYFSSMVKMSQFPGISQDFGILNYFPEYDGTWLMMNLQSVDYILGTNLDDVLDTNLLTNWSGEVYSTYTADEYLRYEHDVYETNVDGTIAYTIDAGTGDVVTNKIHDMGDIVYDNNNDPIIQHHVGDTILDSSGSPIVIGSRITEYLIELSGYDYREYVVDPDFYTKLSAMIDAYYPSIRDMDSNILENTSVFFKPITTLGDTLYKLNNSTTMNGALNIAFTFKCFIRQSVFEDSSLVSTITDKTNEIITNAMSESIISMTNLTSLIMEELNDYINSIDAISVNGNTTVQTLVNMNVDKAPRVGKALEIDDAGVISLGSTLKIDYQTLDL